MHGNEITSQRHPIARTKCPCGLWIIKMGLVLKLFGFKWEEIERRLGRDLSLTTRDATVLQPIRLPHFHAFLIILVLWDYELFYPNVFPISGVVFG